MDSDIIILILIVLIIGGLYWYYIESKLEDIPKSRKSRQNGSNDGSNDGPGTCVYKPPCGPGFELGKTSKGEPCCYLTDDEYQKEQFDKLMKELALNLGVSAAQITIAFRQSIGNNIKNTALGKKVGQVITTRANSLLKGAKSTRLIQALSRIMTKAGVSVSNFAAKAGITGAVATAKSALKAGLAVAAGAFLVFDVISLALDIADPRGFNKARSKAFYKELKEIRDKILQIDVVNEGGSLLVGPLDYIEQSKLEEAAETLSMSILFNGELAWVFEYIYQNQPSDEEAARILDEAMLNVNFDTLAENVFKQLCEDSGGFFIEGENGGCSFKENDCNDYPWPIPKNPDTSNLLIRRFVNGACITEDPTIRLACDEDGLEYDKFTGICKVTPEYCKSKGLDWAYNSKIGEYDCHRTGGQEALELLFGTTVVRAIKTA